MFNIGINGSMYVGALYAAWAGYRFTTLGEYTHVAICMLVVVSGLWVVMSPNLVHSAVSLLFTLFGVAGLYIFLYADFMAASADCGEQASPQPSLGAICQHPKVMTLQSFLIP